MNNLILFLLLINFSAWAKDFGIDGHSFPIIEDNILKVIEERLANIDIDKINQDLKNKTEQYVERPTAVAEIITSKESIVSYYDPSYITKEDIYDHKHNLIYPSGTKINPLEHMPLREALIFIDGDDEKQLKLALNLQKESKLKIILVKGSPLKIQNDHKTWIYFDQAGFITKKLGITKVPALVKQDKLMLRIDIIGKDKYE